jgi:hypothetical protein
MPYKLRLEYQRSIMAHLISLYMEMLSLAMGIVHPIVIGAEIIDKLANSLRIAYLVVLSASIDG